MCPLTQPALPSAYPSLQPKWQIDRFSRFAQLTAECRRVHWRYLAKAIELMLPSVHQSPPKRQMDPFSHFCTAHDRKSLLYNGTPFSPRRNCLFRWGIVPPSNTWFPGPTRVLNPNAISIGSAVFAGLTSVTNRQADHATPSVTIDRTYVRSTAMRSNNTSSESNLIKGRIAAANGRFNRIRQDGPMCTRRPQLVLWRTRVSPANSILFGPVGLSGSLTHYASSC